MMFLRQRRITAATAVVSAAAAAHVSGVLPPTLSFFRAQPHACLCFFFRAIRSLRKTEICCANRARCAVPLTALPLSHLRSAEKTPHTFNSTLSD